MKYILLVEDEPSVAEVEKDYLEINSFRIDIERNGKRGLQRALKIEYDMLILDITLPDMNGFEICRRVREKKDIPILFVSGRIEAIDKIRGFGSGADDYITKPFNPSELVARVRAHLKRYDRLIGKNEQKKIETIRAGELRIDKIARRVFLSDEERNFTSKEFELLLFLASHPNRVFSREQLFRKIWGMQSVGDIATVTVHIKKIREKIEGNVKEPQYIETIWGIGYRFRLQ